MGVSLGKWTKYKLMLQDETLKKYLPETHLINEDKFWELLSRHGKLIIKPSIGRLGRGIKKVSDLGEGTFEIHSGFKKVNVREKGELYKIVCENCGKKKHILQKVIPLATYKNLPFDLRVMVQRKKDSTAWVVTGMAVRVAAKGFFITNAALKVITIEEALYASSFSKHTVSNIKKEIECLALSIAQHLEKHYPQKRRMGIDIGIDEKGKLWIIEVNLKPSIEIFKRLGDETVLTKIRSYRDE